jgi:hypothetical protein
MSDPQVRAAARGLVGNASKIYRSKMMRRLLLALVFSLVSLSSRVLRHAPCPLLGIPESSHAATFMG